MLGYSLNNYDSYCFCGPDKFHLPAWEKVEIKGGNKMDIFYNWILPISLSVSATVIVLVITIIYVVKKGVHLL